MYAVKQLGLQHPLCLHEKKAQKSSNVGVVFPNSQQWWTQIPDWYPERCNIRKMLTKLHAFIWKMSEHNGFLLLNVKKNNRIKSRKYRLWSNVLSSNSDQWWNQIPDRCPKRSTPQWYRKLAYKVARFYFVKYPTTTVFLFKCWKKQ